MQTTIEVHRAATLPEAIRQQLFQWNERIFGPSEYRWAWPEWHVLVWADGQMVSHVGVLERRATVSGQPVTLGGVGSVMTLPAWRGHGLASAAMRRAATLMCHDLGVEFGLLLCAEFRVPLYERLGWQRVAGPLVFEQPSGPVTWREVTMVLPCGGRQWPSGPIDLRSWPW